MEWGGIRVKDPESTRKPKQLGTSYLPTGKFCSGVYNSTSDTASCHLNACHWPQGFWDKAVARQCKHMNVGVKRTYPSTSPFASEETGLGLWCFGAIDSTICELENEGQ